LRAELSAYASSINTAKATGALARVRTKIRLLKRELSDKLSDMKTVTLRALRRSTAPLDSAAAGEEILVTRFGKPYVRILPAARPKNFLGAARHLAGKKPVSPDPIPKSEWKGLA
jgi:antitoxin (DNA-binding transcriptional repressor) of toxin-antitoxin stability system